MSFVYSYTIITAQKDKVKSKQKKLEKTLIRCYNVDMCIKFLFNLFNKGIQIPQKLLKNNEILFYSPNLRWIELGTKMYVEEGYTGFVCFKNKITYSFNAGTHNITRNSIPEIVAKFDRKEIKAKRVKANVYYISTNVQKADFFVKDKHYVFADGQKSPLLLDCKIEYKVLKPNLFLEYVQYIFGNPTNDNVMGNIKYKLYDLVDTYVQKNAVPRTNTYEYFENLKSKLYKSFNDMGLSVSNVDINKLDVMEKSKNKKKFTKKDNDTDTPKSFFDEVPNLPDVYMTLEQPTENNESFEKAEFLEKTYGTDFKNTTIDNSPVPNEYKFCPLCQQRVLSVSKYCNRCGHQF